MKKVKMIVPNKSYSGYYGGVAFSNGVGEFSDVAAAEELAARYGYKIENISTEVEVKVEVVEEVKVKPKPRTKAKPRVKAGE